VWQNRANSGAIALQVLAGLRDILLFLLNCGVLLAPNGYRPIPADTEGNTAYTVYLLAKVMVLPVSLAKHKMAGLKSLPLRQTFCYQLVVCW